MGFSFFRSKKVGPFRINASGSGLGVSFGVKGARINLSPRGTFVNFGANGIYYRKKISGNQKSKSENEEQVEVDYLDTYGGESIGTVNLENLNSVDSNDLIEEIKTKSKKISFVNWLGIFPIICVLFTLCTDKETIEVSRDRTERIKIVVINGLKANIRDAPSNNSNILLSVDQNSKFLHGGESQGSWIKIKGGQLDSNQVAYVYNDLASIQDSSYTINYLEKITQDKENGNLILLLLPIFIGWLVLMSYFDRKRKKIELYYAFDDKTKKLYNNLILGFGDLLKVQRIWHYSYQASITDSKYHAGANKIVKRHKINGVRLDYKPVGFFECNVSIPCISLSGTNLFFLPERLLIQIGKKFGSLNYSEVQMLKSTSNFVEDELVMSDAKVVDQTYKYVNKKGGPDKRFKDNRQIPVCAYSQYELTSNNGLQEMIVTSKLNGMDRLIDALCEIQNYEELI